MITFRCSEQGGYMGNTDEVTITAKDRKEALRMINNGDFIKYCNVIVSTSKELFNLQSPRSHAYFGLKYIPGGRHDRRKPTTQS